MGSHPSGRREWRQPSTWRRSPNGTATVKPQTVVQQPRGTRTPPPLTQVLGSAFARTIKVNPPSRGSTTLTVEGLGSSGGKQWCLKRGRTETAGQPRQDTLVCSEDMERGGGLGRDETQGRSEADSADFQRGGSMKRRRRLEAQSVRHRRSWASASSSRRAGGFLEGRRDQRCCVTFSRMTFLDI